MFTPEQKLKKFDELTIEHDRYLSYKKNMEIAILDETLSPQEIKNIYTEICRIETITSFLNNLLYGDGDRQETEIINKNTLRVQVSRRIVNYRSTIDGIGKDDTEWHRKQIKVLESRISELEWVLEIISEKP